MTPEDKQVAQVLDYQEVFQSEAGRKVLDDLMFRFHVLGSTNMQPGLEYNEGERNVVLHILDQLAVKPEWIRERFKQARDERWHDDFA